MDTEQRNALKAAALKIGAEKWFTDHTGTIWLNLEDPSSAITEVYLRTDGKDEARQSFIAAANPAAILSLIAAVEIAEAAVQTPNVEITSYKPGRWFDARTIDEMQDFYLSRLPAIREAAKEHGYAIGVHGSQRRDFDLMAMQWRADASDKDSLARAIADAACGIRREGAYDWEVKPSGREATSIPICWPAHDNPDFDDMISAGHIDLSILVQGSHQLAAAPQPVAVPDGWKLVPVEPTEAMLEEIHLVPEFTVRALQVRYATMLAAAPAAPSPAVQPAQWDADATERLRSIVDVLGLQSEVPTGDLTGYEFAVLGIVRHSIERMKAAAPQQVVTVDSPELLDLVQNWENSKRGSMALAAWQKLIAHIDAHVSREVAAAIAAQQPAAAPQPVAVPDGEWERAQFICDIPAVDDTIRGFAEDQTGDNATMIVREVMRALAAAPVAPSPSVQPAQAQLNDEQIDRIAERNGLYRSMTPDDRTCKSMIQRFVSEIVAAQSAVQPAQAQGESHIEEIAKAIYPLLPEYRGRCPDDYPWQYGGNSFMQDIARDMARAAIAAQPAVQQDAVDAARYREVRQNAYLYGVQNPKPEELDAKADAAIAKQKGDAT